MLCIYVIKAINSLVYTYFYYSLNT